MHPLLVLLSLVGMYASWKIGWHAEEWAETIRSYRLRATDTHLIIEPKKNDVIQMSEFLTHNEIRGMKWGIRPPYDHLDL